MIFSYLINKMWVTNVRNCDVVHRSSHYLHHYNAQAEYIALFMVYYSCVCVFWCKVFAAGQHIHCR